MILSRPFHVRPYTSQELTEWFGSPVADHECAPLRRVIHLPLVWDEKWDIWARNCLETGAIIPPRT